MPVQASQASLHGPSGFSFALISTASGGMAGMPPWKRPARLRPFGVDCAPLAYAHARWASVRMGTAAAAVVAIRRKERRETEEWSAGIRKSSKIWQRGKGPRCGCRRWQKRGSALGIEATRARPDESDGTTVLRFEHGSKRQIWAADRAYSAAFGRSSLERSKSSQTELFVVVHHRPRSAGCPRRPEAGAPPDPVRDARDGAAAQQEVHQVRQGGGTGHGPVPSARRHGSLRRDGAPGPALQPALSADRRPGQLRLRGWRSAGGDAIYRSPHDAHRGRDARGHRPGHGRYGAQLR